MVFDYFKFIQNKGNLTDMELHKILNISRTQLWRAKTGRHVGEKFISNFKKAYPLLNIDDYFFS